MISHWHDFPSPERTFTSSVWDPFKRSQQIKKSPIKHSYINLQDKFLRPDLFCKLISLNLVISSVQLLSRVRLFATPWTAACQASLSITNSRRLLKFTTLGLVMPSNHLVIPFCSCLQSFPASGSFQMSQLFTSGGQSIGVSASASVIPMNIQDWFPLGYPCSPRDSQESSPTPEFKSINSSAYIFLYSPTLTSIHDHWKNHSLD